MRVNPACQSAKYDDSQRTSAGQKFLEEFELSQPKTGQRGDPSTEQHTLSQNSLVSMPISENIDVFPRNAERTGELSLGPEVRVPVSRDYLCFRHYLDVKDLAVPPRKEAVRIEVWYWKVCPQLFPTSCGKRGIQTDEHKAIGDERRIQQWHSLIIVAIFDEFLPDLENRQVVSYGVQEVSHGFRTIRLSRAGQKRPRAAPGRAILPRPEAGERDCSTGETKWETPEPVAGG